MNSRAESGLSTEDRTRRIRALQTELQMLLAEEVRENSVDGEALKRACLTLARDGNLIDAIKHYRAQSGLSLTKAKHVVDHLLKSSLEVARHG